MTQRITLLSNAAATGAAKDWPGGRGEFAVEGTFGGATISLQAQLPNGTWANIGTDAALTAAGFVGFYLAAGPIRCAVTGGSPSAIYATATPVK